MTRPFAQLAAGWRRFWFEPQDTSTLALVRIAFGLVAVGWTVTLAPNLFTFFGPNGIEPGGKVSYPGEWGILPTPAPPALIIAVFTALLLGSIALTVGLFTRVAAVVVLVGILSFEHANTLIGNSGDGLIRNIAFYLMFAPSGVALSLDRYRKARDRFWEFPARAPWALRLIQIQLSIGYISAVWHKVQSDLWRGGSAVSYSVRIEDIQRFAVPDFLTQSVVLIELLTFGTLALELALGVLIWNRAARPWVMTLGVSLHLGIDYSILIGFFSFAMFVCYLAFVPPETAGRLVLAARDRVRKRRGSPVSRDAEPQAGPTTEAAPEVPEVPVR